MRTETNNTRKVCHALSLSILASAVILFSSVGCKARRNSSTSELLDLTPSADSFFAKFTPEQAATVLDREFRRMPLQAGTDIFSFDFADLARLTGGFNTSIRSLDPGTYLRSDTWRLSTDLIAGSLIQDSIGNALPVNFNIRAGRDITYMRVFDDKIRAAAAVPMTPLAMPLNSEKAIAMAPGDFVSLPVYMGFTLGVSKGAEVPSVALQASLGMIWQGEFRLNVARMDNNFVRVKLAPKDSEGLFLSTSAGVQLDLFGYGPFGVVDLDRQAERLAGLDIFRLTNNRVYRGEAMVVDYIINLNDQYGRMAYDAILENTLAFRAPELIRQAAVGVEDATYADITLAETLHTMDINLPTERKRVSRVFRGSRFYTEDSSKGHFGTRLLRLENSKSLSFNWIKLTDPQNAETAFFYHLFSEGRKQSSWISNLRRNYQNSSVALFSFEQENEYFKDIVFTWDANESKALPEELAGFAWSLYASLGSYYHALGLHTGFDRATPDKFGAKVRVVVHGEMFQAMYELAIRDPQLFEKQLWTAIWMLTPRFQGRQGSRTPAPATSMLGQSRNLLTNTLLSVQQTVGKVLSTEWEGLYRTTASRLVHETRQIQSVTPRTYFQNVMRLMYADEKARELAPAFFLALCEIYRSEPFVTVQMTSHRQSILDKTLGTNPHEALQNMAGSAFQRINQTGYER